MAPPLLLPVGEFPFAQVAIECFHHVRHIQSGDVVPMPLSHRRNRARNSLQSRDIYLRSFISTDAEPTLLVLYLPVTNATEFGFYL